MYDLFICRSSEKHNRIIAANRLVFKMQQLLNFLINNGSLLGHLNPINMVGLEDHLLAQEYELTKDLSVRFTPAMLADRRRAWEELWLEECKIAWLDVLYQAVKSFVLSRINYTDYSTMPGIVLTQKDDLFGNGNANPPPPNKNNGPPQQGKSGKNKKNPGPYIPPDLAPSNVYSHAEAVLLAWSTYHIERAVNLPDLGAASVALAAAASPAAAAAAAAAKSAAASAAANDSKVMISFNKRVVDFDSEFKDLLGFFRLFHSHIPSITSEDEPLAG